MECEVSTISSLRKESMNFPHVQIKFMFKSYEVKLKVHLFGECYKYNLHFITFFYLWELEEVWCQINFFDNMILRLDICFESWIDLSLHMTLVLVWIEFWFDLSLTATWVLIWLKPWFIQHWLKDDLKSLLKIRKCFESTFKSFSSTLT